MEKSNWRLAGMEVTALVVNDELFTKKDVGKVYLVNSEKSIYATEIARKIPKVNTQGTTVNNFQTLNLTTDNFKVRLSNKLDIEISSENLPKIYEWYRVMNIHEDDKNEMISSMIRTSHINLNSGELEDTFELALSDKYPTSVILLSKNMSEYPKAVNRYTRRMAISLNKKTSKFIPGYKYEDLTKSVIYLGTLMTYRSENGFFKVDKSNLKKVHVYVEDVLDTEKTIDDVFRNRKIGTNEGDIKVAFNMGRMYQSKQVLSGNEVTDLSIYWEDHLRICEDRNYSTTSHGYTYLNSLDDVINIFEYFSNTSIKTYDGEVKRLTEKLFKSRLFDILLTSWELVSDTCPVNKTNFNKDGGKKAIDNLITKFYLSNETNNSNKSTYLSDIFKIVGIDIAPFVESTIKYWVNVVLPGRTTDLNNFLKYDRYYLYRFDQILKLSRQRVDSTFVNLKVNTVGSVFGVGELTDILITFANQVRESRGLGVSYFNVYNIGTLKDPKEFCEFKITLDDLVTHYPQISEELSNEIIKKEFVALKIEADLDNPIK